MENIFLSYRREDTSGYAGRLFDRLTQHFGKDRVFMDISRIEAGLDFVETINRALSTSDVFLVMIGSDWLTCKDVSGHRRLDDPNDFIRIETSTALKRNIRVIPVLVQGASMPSSLDLPEDMSTLARRQAHELSDQRWDFDCGELMKVLEKTIGMPEKKILETDIKDQAVSSQKASVSNAKKYSAKAITGLVITLLIYAAYGAEEIAGSEEAIGALVFTLIALVLSIVAFYEIKSEKARGRALAVSNMVLSGILIIALFGEFPGTGAPSPDFIPDNPGNELSRPLSRTNMYLSGIWRGSDGYYYSIEHQDASFAIVGRDAYQNVVLQGNGTVERNIINVQYVSYVDNTSGMAQLNISANGQILAGTSTNSTTGLSMPITLSRYNPGG